MNPKAVFLEDKELVKWWVSVVHDSRFEKVCSLALAAYCHRVIDIAQLSGAQGMLDLLSTFSDSAPTVSRFPSPGLIHETPKRTIEEAPPSSSPPPQPKPTR